MSYHCGNCGQDYAGPGHTCGEPSTLSKRTGLVHMSMFRQMEAERDAARTRLLEVETAHKQAIRQVAALEEERDAAEAARKDGRAQNQRLLDTSYDLAQRLLQAESARDHARDIATRYAAIWGTTDMYEPVECVPAADGWVPGK